MSVTVREAEIPQGHGQQIEIVALGYESEWVPSFPRIPDYYEGIEPVLEPWLIDRLDLPEDPESAIETDDRVISVGENGFESPILDAEFAAIVMFDADEKEWIVEINEALNSNC
jgi:hypothetical protein